MTCEKHNVFGADNYCFFCNVDSLRELIAELVDIYEHVKDPLTVSEQFRVNRVLSDAKEARKLPEGGRDSDG